MKCDVIAEGIIKAAQQVKVDVPIVVRLTGTNADIAFKLMSEFAEKNKDTIKVVVNKDFDTAANSVVEEAANCARQ